jgi:hypothetical protein
LAQIVFRRTDVFAVDTRPEATDAPEFVRLWENEDVGRVFLELTYDEEGEYVGILVGEAGRGEA